MNKKRHHHHTSGKRHHHRKKHLGLKIFLGIVFLLLVVAGAVGYSVYSSVNSTFKSSYEKMPLTTATDLKKSNAFTTLLIETGTLNNQKACFATVLTATNKATNQATFLNIPVSDVLPNQETINSIYASGGEKGVIQYVKSTFGVDINKVVNVNIDKIGTFIEATGGISLQNPKAFVSNGYEFKQGTIHLVTAEQVQAYISKVDHSDINAAITRIQNVSMGLYSNLQEVAHVKKIKSVNYYRQLLYAYTETVRTNIDFGEFKSIVLNYNKALQNTSKLNLHASTVNNIKVIPQSEIDSNKKLFAEALK